MWGWGRGRGKLRSEDWQFGKLGVVGKTVSKLQLRRFISSPPLDILAYDGHYTPVYNLLSRTQPCDLERRRL